MERNKDVSILFAEQNDTPAFPGFSTRLKFTKMLINNWGSVVGPGWGQRLFMGEPNKRKKQIKASSSLFHISGFPQREGTLELKVVDP